MHKYQQSIHHIVTSSDKKGIKKRTCIVIYNKSWNMLEIQGKIWKLKKHCFRKQLLNVFQTFTVINIHKWKKVDYYQLYILLHIFQYIEQHTKNISLFISTLPNCTRTLLSLYIAAHRISKWSIFTNRLDRFEVRIGWPQRISSLLVVAAFASRLQRLSSVMWRAKVWAWNF